MKIFRDPIHNVIDLDTGNKAVNELLIALIDSKEFQRLRFIRQLGFSYLAYPSATHTRFEHSLGVAFLAKRFLGKVLACKDNVMERYEGSIYFDKLACFFESINKTKHFTIIAALLHDIGHGPLSHVMEDVAGTCHEEWTQAIILGNTEVNALLSKFDPDSPYKVCDILQGKTPSSKIIAGQIDVDKIDYLLRDSHMTGSKYGEFDMEWLLNVVTVGIFDEKAEIGLDLDKGLSIAEDFIMARIYMFRNVYLHKTNLQVQWMFRSLMEHIKGLPSSEYTSIFPNESLCRVLLSQGTLEDYLSVSDIDLFYFIKTLQNSENKTLHILSSGILNRHLYASGNFRNSLNHDHNHNLNRDPKDKLTFCPDTDKIFLFDKYGTGHEILDKSLTIPVRGA